MSSLKGPVQSAQVGIFNVDTVERRKNLKGAPGAKFQRIGALPASMRLEIREGEPVFIEKPKGPDSGMLADVVGWSDWSGLPANGDMRHYRFLGIATALHLGVNAKNKHSVYVGGCVTIQNNGTASFQIGDAVGLEVKVNTVDSERVVAYPVNIDDQYIKRYVRTLFQEALPKVEEMIAVPLEEAIDSDLYNVLPDEEKFKRLLVHCATAIPLVGLNVYLQKYAGPVSVEEMALRLGLIKDPSSGIERDSELIDQILSTIFYSINPDSFSSLDANTQADIEGKTAMGNLIRRLGSYFMMSIQTLERLIKGKTVGVVVKGSLPGSKMDVLIHPQ